VRSRPSSHPDGGAAVVEFVGVAALATVVLVALVQVAVVLHVRNTLIDCAAEGARYGALADRVPADGAARTRDLVAADLGGGFAGEVTVGAQTVEGLETVVVTIRAPTPVIGLWGPARTLTVTGHALDEGP
jgi:Flp pilus assembly protein TadG